MGASLQIACAVFDSTARTLFDFPWLLPTHIIDWMVSIFFVESSYLVEGFN